MTQPSDVTVIGKDLVLKMLPKRVDNSHKGTYGHVLNIAGSAQFPGAAYLSSVSSLKSGAGYCTLASCYNVIEIMSCNTPDVTYLDLGQSKFGTIPKSGMKVFDTVIDSDAISIGCGVDITGGVDEFVLEFLKNNKNSYVPIIIDADALNIAALNKFCDFPLNSIITPHPAELSRLLGISVKEIQQNRAKWAWEACKKYDCIVLLKGHETIIAIPNGKVFVNRTGNSALSKAGSGDVLTGMIAGFCAQGAKLEDAACIAAFLHGLSGELAAKTLSEYSVLASDLLRYIPTAIKAVLNAA